MGPARANTAGLPLGSHRPAPVGRSSPHFRTERKEWAHDASGRRARNRWRTRMNGRGLTTKSMAVGQTPIVVGSSRRSFPRGQLCAGGREAFRAQGRTARLPRNVRQYVFNGVFHTNRRAVKTTAGHSATWERAQMRHHLCETVTPQSLRTSTTHQYGRNGCTPT